MNKVALLLLLTTILFSCSGENNSDQLEKENARLRLQKENLQLKNEIHELEVRPNTTEPVVVNREYETWKIREIERVTRGYGAMKLDHQQLAERKASGGSISDVEEVEIIFGPQTLESYESRLSSLRNDAYLKKWSDLRANGQTLQLVDDKGHLKD